MTGSSTPELVGRVVEALDDLKATDVKALDLRNLSNASDYFLIASGNSDQHVRSIGRHVLEELEKQGYEAHHIEGLESGQWVLLDFVDVVVHVFHPTVRDYYQLERLWADAPEIEVKHSD